MSEDTLFRPPTPIPRRSPQSRTLADLLHELMAHGDLSQRDLADAIGVSANTVNQHLHTARVPSHETLVKIARYAHLPITDVCEMADRPSGDPDPFTWPRELDQLTYPERAALVHMGRLILRARAQPVTRGPFTR